MTETSTPATRQEAIMDEAEACYGRVRTAGGEIDDRKKRLDIALSSGHATFKTIVSIEFPLTSLRKEFDDALFISAVHYGENEAAYRESAVELATQEGYQICI